ncbi:MAG: glycerol-3-phosphate dehydrogenase/oxidase [Acidobacteria bacterium]|nr:glycerol-3-phosphate dehydrogenase/oxidase [Acidobacteriota bacterium]MBV9145477.1 glycerol-3-phosphate dehydrogenase/oxidase [Acidobacteriota bacterium]MBV9437866.1 glycerol-3-phosphate dehydrogenase/oxidase [Acidobacteriota bacterium]
MRVAVIGGGINGVMSAWALARRGHDVHLFERGEQLMGATSSASTKLIHGGLRYLEHGEFRLVREALRERLFWISSAPHLVHKLQLVLPVYKSSRRPGWVMRCGLMLYDWLAGKSNLGKYEWLDRGIALTRFPELNCTELLGAFTFFDAQMDDRALGLWAGSEAVKAGVRIRTASEVTSISETGELRSNGVDQKYDLLVNIAGPWAESLLSRNGISSEHQLDLVRGSHLVLSRQPQHAFLVEVPDEERFCFILPYHGQTLLGTTEVRQSLSEPIACSKQEEGYLLRVYNHYIRPAATDDDIVGRFSGLRPLIRSRSNPSAATREYAIERQGQVLTVFGGKWTTSHALGERIAVLAQDVLSQSGNS